VVNLDISWEKWGKREFEWGHQRDTSVVLLPLYVDFYGK